MQSVRCLIGISGRKASRAIIWDFVQLHRRDFSFEKLYQTGCMKSTSHDKHPFICAHSLTNICRHIMFSDKRTVGRQVFLSCISAYERAIGVHVVYKFLRSKFQVGDFKILFPELVKTLHLSFFTQTFIIITYCKFPVVGIILLFIFSQSLSTLGVD